MKYNITAKRIADGKVQDPQKGICIKGIRNDERMWQLVQALLHEGFKVTIIGVEENPINDFIRSARETLDDAIAEAEQIMRANKDNPEQFHTIKLSELLTKKHPDGSVPVD